MQVILLERVEKLGTIGDVVDVKPGFARNFLLPQDKALRATKDNVAYFEAQKKHIEKDNESRKKDAEKDAKKVSDTTVALIRQASEGGQLYGSVTSRDISDAINEAIGSKLVHRKMVVLEQNYKTLGLYPVKIMLHAEVEATVTINIARSAEEAKTQEDRGEALILNENEPALQTQAVESIEAEDVDAEVEPETEVETVSNTDAPAEDDTAKEETA